MTILWECFYCTPILVFPTHWQIMSFLLIWAILKKKFIQIFMELACFPLKPWNRLHVVIGWTAAKETSTHWKISQFTEAVTALRHILLGSRNKSRRVNSIDHICTQFNPNGLEMLVNKNGVWIEIWKIIYGLYRLSGGANFVCLATPKSNIIEPR